MGQRCMRLQLPTASRHGMAWQTRPHRPAPPSPRERAHVVLKLRKARIAVRPVDSQLAAGVRPGSTVIDALNAAERPCNTAPRASALATQTAPVCSTQGQPSSNSPTPDPRTPRSPPRQAAAPESQSTSMRQWRPSKDAGLPGLSETAPAAEPPPTGTWQPSILAQSAQRVDLAGDVGVRHPEEQLQTVCPPLLSPRGSPRAAPTCAEQQLAVDCLQSVTHSPVLVEVVAYGMIAGQRLSRRRAPRIGSSPAHALCCWWELVQCGCTRLAAVPVN